MSTPGSQRRSQPRPLQTTDLATVGAGLSLWLVALGVLVGLRQSGAATVADWWVWVCVAGFALGFCGLWLLWRRTVRARRAPVTPRSGPSAG